MTLRDVNFTLQDSDCMGHLAESATRSVGDEWVPVAHAPGYFANARGQILGPKGRVLVESVIRQGYRQIGINYRGKYQSRRVHQLICETFHGERPSDLHEVAHFDGNPANNTPDNLRWVTRKENSADKRRHGRQFSGETHPRATVTETQVIEIRRIYAANKTGNRAKRGIVPRLSRQFDIPRSNIASIVSGRTWQRITGEGHGTTTRKQEQAEGAAGDRGDGRAGG